MGKSDFLTPKAIANRIKSKGLQKLRWYCQMCQKQCRDENGFKCHCMSESHQRQLLLASENPQQFMDYFSEEFRNDFLELLRRRFGTKRVHNNIVYNEYISHREHIHMNATQWETLTDFTKWLGREGKNEISKLEAPTFTELSRENDEEKVTFNLSKGACSSSGATSSKSSCNRNKNIGDNFQTLCVLQIEEEKKRTARTDYWLQPVSIQSLIIGCTSIGGLLHAYRLMFLKFGAKLVYGHLEFEPEEVIDKYTAVVKMIDSGDKLKLDQTHLETVIPAPGKRILVLNGGYRGNEGTLESINEKTFSATIVIETGPLKGRRVEGIQYEDFSKLA
ncbi:PREDICTED: DNA/RNA-binding protein KIN17 [Mandrillus leucophaeus]|uniref:DNA/RNA-binding protein KIN17 n=1 Tax=Mandrillus leucophaeus TaxID=9568 RepID=UPI0005F3C2E7|nr:PREDICTED: DNA/RNA-binding protein KIN17 [Mandrillus leucophaeus]